jgi:anti-sigma B factor antagonist
MIEPLPPTGLDIEASSRDGHGVLVLRGELDIASVPSLERALSRSCTDGSKTIRIDLSRLVFIDSTGLAAIVLAGKLCEKHDIEFSLVQGSKAVRRLFELTGLIDVLPFEQDDHVPVSSEDLSQA